MKILEQLRISHRELKVNEIFTLRLFAREESHIEN